MAVDPGITLYLNVNLSGKFHDSRDPACIFFFEVWLVTEDKWKQERNGISDGKWADTSRPEASWRDPFSWSSVLQLLSISIFLLREYGALHI